MALRYRNNLLSALDAADVAALAPHMTETALSRGQVLFEPQDPVEAVYFPSNAVLSVVTVMLDGREAETASVGRENAVGLLAALAETTAPARIFAQIAGSAIRIPATALRARVADSPGLRIVLLRHALAQTVQAEQGVACNVLHDASSRMARWLLMTEDRVGGGPLELTQEYLSIMTGVQRTTISAIAASLRADGLIDYKRGAIRILDRAGLERQACECYQAIRDRSEDLLSDG